MDYPAAPTRRYVVRIKNATTGHTRDVTQYADTAYEALSIVEEIIDVLGHQATASVIAGEKVA